MSTTSGVGDPTQGSATALAVASARLGAVTSQAVVQQAKGALMLRYGIGSHPALGVLLSWSHEADTSLDTLAGALVHGICEIGPTVEDGSDPGPAALRLWLQQRLRAPAPDDLAPDIWATR